MADPFYMNSQLNINAKMLCILVDWVVDIVDEYNIKDEALFFKLLPRFLQQKSSSSFILIYLLIKMICAVLFM